jgi:phospholipid/cholesterol/gamma-HCH transport system substrate-binding protein
MTSDKVKLQLAVFAMLTLTALALITFVYVKVPALMGIGQMTVTAKFTEGGGVYPFANVTYRGVTVGKVKSVSLDKGDVAVKMSIDASADVPSNLTATVKSVSAIGEQYVDLVPDGKPTGAMASGAVIPVDKTKVPVPIATVLDDVDGLITSVPEDSLGVVLDEAGKAFDDLGPALTALVTNSQNLLNEADKSYESTSSLIADGETVLDTQTETSSEVRAWASDLNGFTDELRSSDAEVRDLLETVPGAAEQARGTLQDLGETVPALADSGQVLADLADSYHAPIEQILNAFPRGLATMLANARPDRDYTFNLALRTIVNSPGVCNTVPKSGTKYGPRGPSALSDLGLAPDTYCKIPQSDPRVARGSRNLQCFEPGSPAGRRAATIYQCRGDGYKPVQPGDDPEAPVSVANPLAWIGNQLLAGSDRGAQQTAPAADDGLGLLDLFPGVK